MAEIIAWNEQRQALFEDRYALRGPSGELAESEPHQMWARVAHAFAENDIEGKLFFEALRDWRFVPAGRILSGAGLERKVTYYNCFVLGMADEYAMDSRRAIMGMMSNLIEVTCRGGGAGINWSVLRPSGSYIRGVNGESRGPISWMRGADALADCIRQGGTRTAALMFLLEDWHPDIWEFVGLEDRFHRANFSVGVSDVFMHRVKEDGDWDLIYPDTSYAGYDSLWNGDIRWWFESGKPVKVWKTVKARDLWRRICDRAWATGNPGVVFLERCDNESTTSYLGRISCTNPCGEQPLPIWGACNLGAINLLAHWDSKAKEIDLVKLWHTVAIAVRLLDNVISMDVGVHPAVTASQMKARRIGIGTMGLADVLLLSKMRYGSDGSINLASLIFRMIRDAAYEASALLAAEKGCAGGYDQKFLKSKFVQNLPFSVLKLIVAGGIRNLSLLSQAPTGTTSILAGASSGIEPIFSRTYTRKDATGEYVIEHPLFPAFATDDYLVTASEIPAEGHVRIQAAAQKFIDGSVSKTINLPFCATSKDVKEAFELAYELGCKGVTVYREDVDSVLTSGECAVCKI